MSRSLELSVLSMTIDDQRNADFSEAFEANQLEAFYHKILLEDAADKSHGALILFYLEKMETVTSHVVPFLYRTPRAFRTISGANFEAGSRVCAELATAELEKLVSPPILLLNLCQLQRQLLRNLSTFHGKPEIVDKAFKLSHAVAFLLVAICSEWYQISPGCWRCRLHEEVDFLRSLKVPVRVDGSNGEQAEAMGQNIEAINLEMADRRNLSLASSSPHRVRRTGTAGR